MLLARRGDLSQVKLTDFGLSAVIDSQSTLMRDAVGTPRRAIGIVRGDAAIAAVAAESDMGGRRCASVRVGNANQVSRCRVRWCACD